MSTTANTHRVAALVEQLGKAIGTREVSIATAESCTGGMLSGAIVANPEVSGALERGLVVYSLDAKCELLDLDRAEVERCQGVSRAVAEGMAASALDRSHADIAVAITGFAGPQEDEEEVGLVHIACAQRGGATAHQEEHFGDLGRAGVCEAAVAVAVEMLIDAVGEFVTGT